MTINDSYHNLFPVFSPNTRQLALLIRHPAQTLFGHLKLCPKLCNQSHKLNFTPQYKVTNLVVDL